MDIQKRLDLDLPKVIIVTISRLIDLWLLTVEIREANRGLGVDLLCRTLYLPPILKCANFYSFYCNLVLTSGKKSRAIAPMVTQSGAYRGVTVSWSCNSWKPLISCFRQSPERPQFCSKIMQMHLFIAMKPNAAAGASSAACKMRATLRVLFFCNISSFASVWEVFSAGNVTHHSAAAAAAMNISRFDHCCETSKYVVCAVHALPSCPLPLQSADIDSLGNVPFSEKFPHVDTTLKFVCFLTLTADPNTFFPLVIVTVVHRPLT